MHTDSGPCPAVLPDSEVPDSVLQQNWGWVTSFSTDTPDSHYTLYTVRMVKINRSKSRPWSWEMRILALFGIFFLQLNSEAWQLKTSLDYPQHRQHRGSLQPRLPYLQAMHNAHWTLHTAHCTLHPRPWRRPSGCGWPPPGLTWPSTAGTSTPSLGMCRTIYSGLATPELLNPQTPEPELLNSWTPAARCVGNLRDSWEEANGPEGGYSCGARGNTYRSEMATLPM